MSTDLSGLGLIRAYGMFTCTNVHVIENLSFCRALVNARPPGASGRVPNVVLPRRLRGDVALVHKIGKTERYGDTYSIKLYHTLGDSHSHYDCFQTGQSKSTGKNHVGGAKEVIFQCEYFATGRKGYICIGGNCIIWLSLMSQLVGSYFAEKSAPELDTGEQRAIIHLL